MDSENTPVERRPGVAPIKPEYLIKTETFISTPNRDGEKVLSGFEEPNKESQKEENGGDEAPRKKMRGQNKSRRNEMHKNQLQLRKDHHGGHAKLCRHFVFNDGNCSYGDSCKLSHDIDAFLASRKPDIKPECHLFNEFGRCEFGPLCRFGLAHYSIESKTNCTNDARWIDGKGKERYSSRALNSIDKDVQTELRKRNYDFSKANEVIKSVKKNENSDEPLGPIISDTFKESKIAKKKKFEFDQKLYLAPLTTVGNLPFRRICKIYGADITCGEMAMATNILEGKQSEWALLKKHPSEDIFGVQICGAHVDSMTRCAQLINDQCEVDFIDINMGCPIDIVYQKGAGSGLMDRKTKLKTILAGVTSVIDVPLTLKMRTGVYQSKHCAHKVIETVKSEGYSDDIGLITIHGRSREQRYIKTPDWDYVNECASLAKPIPVFGSGDCLSYVDYYERLKCPDISGVMVARGALIKPWIFTEIKETRHWDITSKERLEMLQRFVNYGLENWGSDYDGVEKTRRFLLEWLSFLYRYIPVGLLEVLPQKINERPPAFSGRDELETLMASPNCNDWIKISEMLLGPAPDGFIFIPKHKANAY